MARHLAHPDAARLQAFNQGRSDDDDATVIAAHLDTCVECQHKLEALSGDTLENLVRTADTLPASERVEPMPEWLEYFRVERVLGQGGMGTVYLAHDTRLHRHVAVKTLRRELTEKPAARDRFLREARAAAALEHDHITPIYYVGDADGVPFLAMPLLKGTSLEEYRKQADGAVPLPEAVRIARQIALGLAAAHERGLIHRDIKPTNIWLEASPGAESGEFRVKILDFGLARLEQNDARASYVTQSGTIVGTPAYMAPEQARGEPLDGRADLFSLGCVLYQLTTGRRPFAGPTTISILTSIAVGQPPAPNLVKTDVPAELSELIMRLLEKDRASRPGWWPKPSGKSPSRRRHRLRRPRLRARRSTDRRPRVLK